MHEPSGSLSSFLEKRISTASRSSLRQSVIPTLLHSITSVATCLRTTSSIQQAGSTNTSGDNQLNVDLATNEAIHSAIRMCPAIVTASSEEDEGENSVKHESTISTNGEIQERYSVAFDPLDGSSIVGANWTVGTIIGIWDGVTALNQNPREKQIAAILGVLGPRITAIVAIRLPEGGESICFEVALGDNGKDEIQILRSNVCFSSIREGMTRYFAPANLRAASHFPAYATLINHFISHQYTLRYSGGLVPDVVHALVKGHGIYVSPVTTKSKAKLRRLYELTPIALIMECAGGRAVDPDSGKDILAITITSVDDKSGLVCGTEEEVNTVMNILLTES